MIWVPVDSFIGEGLLLNLQMLPSSLHAGDGRFWSLFLRKTLIPPWEPHPYDLV